MEREKNQEIQEKERELRRVNQQLEESKRLIADFDKRITKLSKVMRSQMHDKDGGGKAGVVDRPTIKLRWKRGAKAPCRYHEAVVHNHTVYCKYNSLSSIYSYHIPSSNWSLIPNCPNRGGFGLVVIDGLLTVEVLNIETRQWHTAPDLPEPVSEPSLALCGDLVYLLGGFNERYAGINSVYSCSLSSLLSPPGSKSLGGRLMSTRAPTRFWTSMWNRVPLTGSTTVSLHGRLLAIGGMDSQYMRSTAVHMYQPTTNSWELISHMTTPRYLCLAAVLPDNQLMVVGGYTAGGKGCDSVEFGTVI